MRWQARLVVTAHTAWTHKATLVKSHVLAHQLGRTAGDDGVGGGWSPNHALATTPKATEAARHSATTAPRLMRRARDAGFSGLLVAESGYSRADELGSVRGLAEAVLVGGSVAGSRDLESAVQRFRTDLDALQTHA